MRRSTYPAPVRGPRLPPGPSAGQGYPGPGALQASTGGIGLGLRGISLSNFAGVRRFLAAPAEPRQSRDGEWARSWDPATDGCGCRPQRAGQPGRGAWVPCLSVEATSALGAATWCSARANEAPASAGLWVPTLAWAACASAARGGAAGDPYAYGALADGPRQRGGIGRRPRRCIRAGSGATRAESARRRFRRRAASKPPARPPAGAAPAECLSSICASAEAACGQTRAVGHRQQGIGPDPVLGTLCRR